MIFEEQDRIPLRYIWAKTVCFLCLSLPFQSQRQSTSFSDLSSALLDLSHNVEYYRHLDEWTDSHKTMNSLISVRCPSIVLHVISHQFQRASKVKRSHCAQVEHISRPESVEGPQIGSFPSVLRELYHGIEWPITRKAQKLFSEQSRESYFDWFDGALSKAKIQHDNSHSVNPGI